MSAIDPESSPAPGLYFNAHFQYEEQIGSGGFGWVCKAVRLSDCHMVAIKLILKNRMVRESIIRATWPAAEGLDMWEDGTMVLPLEAWVLRQARHRGVVDYLDLFADENYFYLVMEHHGSPWIKPSNKQEDSITPVATPPSPPLTPPMTSLPLHSLPRTSTRLEAPATARPAPLRRSSALNSLVLTTMDTPSHPTKMAQSMPMVRRSSSSDLFQCIEQHSYFPETTARFLFTQIAQTIYDLRLRGITHRDLKDENIVVDAAGCVKLIDFGSALYFRSTEPVPLCTRFFGTISSASPETLGDDISYHPHPAEVWSLGVLLHVLLTGSTPFPTRHHIRHAQRNRRLMGLSEAAHDLLDRCFTVDVDSRITLEGLLDHPWMRPSALRV